MEIRMVSLLSGAREAEGAVVIIDVYRAFTTAAVAFLRGAKKLILVGDPAEALDLRARGRGKACVGEVEGRKAEGFEFGNSPFELCRADLAGQTLIQSTRAGTTGVEAARKAVLLFGGSLVTAAATAQVIRELDPPVVTLVAMGWKGEVRTDEDELCAGYLAGLLEGEEPDRNAVREQVAMAPESAKFDDPAKPHFHPRDKEIALRIDSVPFAIQIAGEGGLLVARPVTPLEQAAIALNGISGEGK